MYDTLGRQRIFHKEYNPTYKNKESRFFMQRVMGVSNEAITVDDVGDGATFDPRYM
jgi:hypothetical protein